MCDVIVPYAVECCNLSLLIAARGGDCGKAIDVETQQLYLVCFLIAIASLSVLQQAEVIEVTLFESGPRAGPNRRLACVT